MRSTFRLHKRELRSPVRDGSAGAVKATRLLPTAQEWLAAVSDANWVQIEALLVPE